tara:strand:+ start:1667 stop:2167 length:501 start_codon:yes stop_codon:yes gene_type:complete
MATTNSVDRVLDLAAQIKEGRSKLEAMEAEFNGMIGNGAKPKRAATGKKRGRPAKKAAPAATTKAPKPKKRGRPAGSKNKKSAAKTDDKRNATPLTRLIPEILVTPDGADVVWLSHPEIVKAILDRGYQTASKDFENVVYQTLRKKVRDEELVYDEDELKFALADK